MKPTVSPNLVLDSVFPHPLALTECPTAGLATIGQGAKEEEEGEEERTQRSADDSMTDRRGCVRPRSGEIDFFRAAAGVILKTQYTVPFFVKMTLVTGMSLNECLIMSPSQAQQHFAYFL